MAKKYIEFSTPIHNQFGTWNMGQVYEIEDRSEAWRYIQANHLKERSDGSVNQHSVVKLLSKNEAKERSEQLAKIAFGASAERQIGDGKPEDQGDGGKEPE